MAVRVEFTFDSVNAARLARFWKEALGYVDEPAPAPFRTRAEWLRSYGEEIADDEDITDGAWLCDPDGARPRICILNVPEPKAAKNRLHLDLRVSGTGEPAQKWARITDKVAALRAAGGTVLHEFEGHHVVMADPEGNEFCVA